MTMLAPAVTNGSAPVLDLSGTLAPRSIEWWVDRLDKRLDSRRAEIARFDAYYRGDHPLPIAPRKAQEAYRRLLKQSRSNWMALVVDAVAERLSVEGFRFGSDASADKQAWKIYQANGLDVGSESIHLEAGIAGESYATVAPNPDDPKTPLIFPEHPSQMIVATGTTYRERLAAWKKWLDDSGHLFGTLYFPDFIYKFRSDRPVKEGLAPTSVRWTARAVNNETWPLRNPLGEVSVVPFCNKPRMLTGGVSELADLTDIQDRINKTIFDRLMAAEVSAFRQRWVTGMEIPTDPETGEDREPFEAAVDRLWMSEDEKTHFGEFSETTLSGYISSVEADIQHLAAISRTPPHYLLGQSGAFPSGESLKSTETGLVAKVNRRAKHFGESWEDVMRLAFKAAGSPKAKVTNAETIWANPESRTMGELTDALLKMRQLKAPIKALWAKWGLSPQEVEQWLALLAEEAQTGIFDDPAHPAPVSPAPGAMPAPLNAATA